MKLKNIAFAVVVLASGAAQANANVITNGDFTIGPVGHALDG
jgi:hypothetical protein